MRVTVVGAGYVGTASALALAASAHDVCVLDLDPGRVAALQRGEDPLGERYVAQLLASGLSIRSTTDEREAYRSADAVLIAVGTPPRSDGMADLADLHAAASSCARFARRAIVLIRSTVPVGTADRLRQGTLAGFRVISNPEFLREGRAVLDSFHPDRIVAGGDSADERTVRELYAPIIEQRFAPVAGITPTGSPRPFFWMDRRSAELAKYAANAFLATKLSFVNEIANVASSLDADIRAVLPVLAADPRIGPSFLRPGIGWGGSCFPKDTRALAAFAAEVGDELMVLRAAIERNNAQMQRFFRGMRSELASRGDVHVGLLGLAFKEDTADCRESPAVALARQMLDEGWRVRAYDPAVRTAPAAVPDIAMVDSILEAAQGADAVVVATEWSDFGRADLAEVRGAMRGDLLFDGRCIIDPTATAAAGLRYRGICPPPRRD